MTFPPIFFLQARQNRLLSTNSIADHQLPAAGGNFEKSNIFNYVFRYILTQISLFCNGNSIFYQTFCIRMRFLKYILHRYEFLKIILHRYGFQSFSIPMHA